MMHNYRVELEMETQDTPIVIDVGEGLSWRDAFQFASTLRFYRTDRCKAVRIWLGYEKLVMEYKF